MLGFTLTAVMVQYATWKWSFWLQGVFILPCALIFLTTPGKYLDIDGTSKARVRCAHNVQQKLYKKLNLETVPHFGAGEGVTSMNSNVRSSSVNSAMHDRSASQSKRFGTALETYT